jgi:hypothetical protein
MTEYEGREFCRSIDCVMQIRIDENIVVDVAKKYCHECCDAYKFHKWLQENGYQIVKDAKFCECGEF